MRQIRAGQAWTKSGQGKISAWEYAAYFSLNYLIQLLQMR